MGRSFITVNYNSTTDVASSVPSPEYFCLVWSLYILWSVQCSSRIQWSFPSHVVISVVLCEKALAVQGVCVRERERVCVNAHNRLLKNWKYWHGTLWTPQVSVCVCVCVFVSDCTPFKRSFPLLFFFSFSLIVGNVFTSNFDFLFDRLSIWEIGANVNSV